MDDNISYQIDKTEINKQDMHFVIINRHPQYFNMSSDVPKRKVEQQLYNIFRKYA